MAPAARPGRPGRLAPVDELAVNRLLATYCQIVDDGQFDRLPEVFDPAVVHTIDGMQMETVRHEGLEALTGFISARQVDSWRGKHILSVPLIRVAGPAHGGPGAVPVQGPRAGLASRATAMTEVTFINRTGPDASLRIATTGRYHDTLALKGGRWWIVRRAIDMY